MKVLRKNCVKCGVEMNRVLEACPVCREKQPAAKTTKLWIALVVVLLVWVAFR